MKEVLDDLRASMRKWIVFGYEKSGSIKRSEYRQKKENVMKMAAKLRSGFYIKKAVDVIMRRDTVSGYGS